MKFSCNMFWFLYCWALITTIIVMEQNDVHWRKPVSRATCGPIWAGDKDTNEVKAVREIACITTHLLLRECIVPRRIRSSHQRVLVKRTSERSHVTNLSATQATTAFVSYHTAPTSTHTAGVDGEVRIPHAERAGRWRWWEKGKGVRESRATVKIIHIHIIHIICNCIYVYIYIHNVIHTYIDI